MRGMMAMVSGSAHKYEDLTRTETMSSGGCIGKQPSYNPEGVL